MATKPSLTSKRKSDYEERSALVAAEIDEIERKSRLDVRRLISGSLIGASQTLIDIMNSSSEEARRESSAKHLLKLGGLEIERVEHDGKVKLVPKELEMDV